MGKYSKKKAEFIHARRRMRQRFGIEMGQVRRRMIVQAIQAGKAEFLGRQSCRVTLWRVEVDGAKLSVVYDNKRKEIVTVLPKGGESPPAERRCGGL